jgi:HlyD family secretion protein
MGATGTTPFAGQRSRPLTELVEREKKRRRGRRLWQVAILVVLVAGGGAAWRRFRPRPLPIAARFRMQAVVQGDLLREVRASGNLEAVTTVQVGAQTSGRIATVEADYNDRVKAGQVLARFELSALQAQLAQTQANLAAARASLEQSKTDSDKSQRDLMRAEQLWQQKVQSDADHDTAANAARLAQQRVSVAEAQLAAQEAANAAARTNMDYAVIHSPIDGVVITRNVDPGQTVASGFQTPVLFQVAADLRKMRLVVPIDEADIGQVQVGQHATFTVDAYPGRTFSGTVTKVRNSPVTVENVVTYGGEIEVDNSDLALRPGMTASVRIRTAQAANVLTIPNPALRFIPPTEKAAEGPGVWTLNGDTLRRVAVRPGISDGEKTVIEPGALSAGSNVIVDLTTEGRKAYAVSP